MNWAAAYITRVTGCRAEKISTNGLTTVRNVARKLTGKEFNNGSSEL